MANSSNTSNSVAPLLYLLGFCDKQTTGVPVIPFIDLGSSGGTLSDDTRINGVFLLNSLLITPTINLPSPLPLGDATETRAYVSSCLMHTTIMYSVILWQSTGQQQWPHQLW